MSKTYLEKLSHSCGSREGLQVILEDDGRITGYCFACGQYVPMPYGKPVTAEEIPKPKTKTKEQIEEEINEISTYKTVDCPTRKLRASYLSEFGIKTSLSEEDGKTPTAMYFPIRKSGVVTGYYVKTLGLDKNFTWAIGDVSGGEPFGWKEAKESGSYKLYITEGKEDAVAVKSIFDRHGKEEFRPAVISLTNGVQSVNKNLSPIAAEITRMFKEIVIVFDDDEAGQNAVEKALQILPTAKSVTVPNKDPNGAILAGKTKAAFTHLSFNATRPKNTRLVIAGPELHQQAREPTPYGELTWPYPKLQKLLRGIRYGETIYIGAGVKMGKSELLNDLAAHFIKHHDVPVFMAKPEEVNKKTYKLMCNKIVGWRFHDPDVEFSYEKFDKAGEVLANKLVMVDLYQHIGWDSLRQDIIAAAAFGCKVVFIDPITNLTAGMSSGDANNKLEEIAVELSSLAKDLQIVIFIFCHLKSSDGSISKDVRATKYKKGEFLDLGPCAHEYGGSISSNQFTGSRAMMRSCNLMLGLAGNKDPDIDENIRSIRRLIILEDREFGNSEGVDLFWNPKTTLYHEA